MTQTGVVSWSQTAATNASADSNVNWAEGMAPSQVNDSARAEMASVAKWRDDLNGTVVTSGSSGAFTATSNQNFSALTVLDGQSLRVRFKSPNSASATLNIDGLGAKPLQVDATNALPAGRITTDSIWDLTYDNTAGAFIVKNSGFGNPGLTLLQRQSASNSPTIDFATGLSSFYDHYLLKISHAIPASATVNPSINIGTGGGPTYHSTAQAYQYAWHYVNSNPTNSSLSSSGATGILVGNSVATTTQSAGTAYDAEIRFTSPLSTSAFPIVDFKATYITTLPLTESANGGGFYQGNGPVTGVRFLFTSGNIASGIFSLYGYASG